ncbi:hypothetical protein MRX96_020183 [Rhipicephalus microplus]
MQYLALVLSIVGGTVFLGLLLAAICSYYWISQRHYPCAWSATADAKSDVYYKKTAELEVRPERRHGANPASQDEQCDAVDSTTNKASNKESRNNVTSYSGLEITCENKTAM